MYSYCPNPCVSLWLGCLTTTPHYWPLHYTTLWCGWTTMSNTKRSCLRTKTLFLKDWLKSCVSSVADWCSIKHKGRVLPLECLNNSDVTGDFFSFTFLPWRWHVGAYREWTCRKRGQFSFFFFTNGFFSLLTTPFAQNSYFSTALLPFQAVFMCVWITFCFD